KTATKMPCLKLQSFTFFFSLLALTLIVGYESANTSLGNCQNDIDCSKVAANSKCYQNQCICRLGYQLNQTVNSCVETHCANPSDCTAIFPNTTCSKQQPESPSGVCICDSTHRLDDGPQSCSILVSSPSSSMQWIIFGSIVLAFLA